MQTFITSDVHIGSQHCQCERFAAFLDGLPPEAELVLAGDVVDRWHHGLTGAHAAALDKLLRVSRERRVVWIRGNHDDDFEPEDSSGIEFKTEHAIGRDVFVAHGDHFDNITPYHKWFMHVIFLVHSVRSLLGARSMHVAKFAKRFGFLYGVFRDHVAMNAVEHARENGFTAVVCGHTHADETRVIDGIRYMNTGAWTETPHYVVYENGEPAMLPAPCAPETSPGGRHEPA